MGRTSDRPIVRPITRSGTPSCLLA